MKLTTENSVPKNNIYQEIVLECGSNVTECSKIVAKCDRNYKNLCQEFPKR